MPGGVFDRSYARGASFLPVHHNYRLAKPAGHLGVLVDHSSAGYFRRKKGSLLSLLGRPIAPLTFSAGYVSSRFVAC